jgi:hypothetical protein
MTAPGYKIMWPFSRKKPPAPAPPADLPAEDIWSLRESEVDGEPMIMRINTTAREYLGHPELPVRLGIALPLNAPNRRGLPDEPETRELDAIEGGIFEAVDPHGRVVFVVTTSGMREVVSYVRTAAHAEEIVARVRAIAGTHEVHYYIEDDPEWEEFQTAGGGS